jgi:hypothetical protein
MVGQLNQSRRSIEALAIQAHLKGIGLAPVMEVGNFVRDAQRWEVDPELLLPSLMQDITGSCCRRHGKR